jgi:hypothetical protein
LKKAIGILLLMFSISSIAEAKGGVHIKGCKVKSAPHAKLAFPKATTNNTDDNRKKKDLSPKPADWPWWLGS